MVHGGYMIEKLPRYPEGFVVLTPSKRLPQVIDRNPVLERKRNENRQVVGLDIEDTALLGVIEEDFARPLVIVIADGRGVEMLDVILACVREFKRVRGTA